MKREYSVSGLVYNYLFPTPTANDPTDFPQHLQRNLVSEVRIETQRFYGGLETVEARYPGLNYSFGPHRKRLGRFPHHNRLFKAFDALGLTEHEIATLCRWEGTLWARLRYERDEGIKVIDTTGNEILPCAERRHLKRKAGSTGRIQGITRVPSAEGIKVKTEIEVEIEEVRNAGTVAPILSRVNSQQQSESRMPTPRPVQMFRRPESLDAIMQDAAHHPATTHPILPTTVQISAQLASHPPQTYTSFTAPELLASSQSPPPSIHHHHHHHITNAPTPTTTIQHGLALVPAPTPLTTISTNTTTTAFEPWNGNKEDPTTTSETSHLLTTEQDAARSSMSPSPAPVAVAAAANLASMQEGQGEVASNVVVVARA